MYTYKFKVRIGFDEEEYVDCGFVTAESMTEAMRKLEFNYHNDLMDVVTLRAIGDSEIIIVPEEVVDQYAKEFIW